MLITGFSLITGRGHKSKKKLLAIGYKSLLLDISYRLVFTEGCLGCYALWQKRTLKGLYKIRRSHSSLFFAKNSKKIFSKIFQKFSRFFSKFFEIRKFQMTRSDLKWTSNESWQYFKNSSWKIKFRKTRFFAIFHDVKFLISDEKLSFRL